MDRDEPSSLSAATRPSRIGILRLVPVALRAVLELGLARLQHLHLVPSRIQALNREVAGLGETGPTNQEAIVDDVAFVIPRVAARLPWRSDCLIQAMAAQRWLKSKGICSSISIGVTKPADGEFSAHAWLKFGDRIVTGGDITPFSPLLVPEEVRD